MNTEVALNPLVSSGSLASSPSSKYIGYWPMTMWVKQGEINRLEQPNSCVDTAEDAITGFTSSAWAVAGIAVKIRSASAMPTPLSATVVYYAGKPTIDKMTFYDTKENALAGISTGRVDITSTGAGNITVYPAYIKDHSNQGNDLIYGSIIETTVLNNFPYMNSASSGEHDYALGRLPNSTFIARYKWPTDTCLFLFRVKFSGLILGRSFFGNSTPSSTDGLRLNVDPNNASKLQLRIAYDGSGAESINVTSASEACSTTSEHHIAVALSGPSRQAIVWIDGLRDLNISSKDLSAVTTMSFADDLRIGGAASNNSQEAHFRDYHAFAWTGSLPQNIDALITRAATTYYHRWSDTDL